MKDINISIIVPIYNVEEFLARCIDSLLNQTYKKIEIILVNDGSTDNSPLICNEYQKKYSRIKVIHKINGGLSDARNVGLKNSNSDYILFVDSDDYIEKDSCEKFINILKEEQYVDIIVGNAKKIQNNKEKLIIHSKEKLLKKVNGLDFLKAELKNGTMHMAAWLNLYNREFLLKNKLEFKKNLLHEDEEFTPRTFLKAKSVILTEIIFYNYIIRENSITTQKKLEKNAIDILKTCIELEKIYIQIENKELKELLRDNLVTKYLYAFQIGKLYKKKYNNILDKKFLRENVYSKKNRYKVNIFCINKKIYFFINFIHKLIRGQ